MSKRSGAARKDDSKRRRRGTKGAILYAKASSSSSSSALSHDKIYLDLVSDTESFLTQEEKEEGERSVKPELACHEELSLITAFNNNIALTPKTCGECGYVLGASVLCDTSKNLAADNKGLIDCDKCIKSICFHCTKECGELSVCASCELAQRCDDCGRPGSEVNVYNSTRTNNPWSECDNCFKRFVCFSCFDPLSKRCYECQDKKKCSLCSRVEDSVRITDWMTCRDCMESDICERCFLWTSQKCLKCTDRSNRLLENLFILGQSEEDYASIGRKNADESLSQRGDGDEEEEEEREEESIEDRSYQSQKNHHRPHADEAERNRTKEDDQEEEDDDDGKFNFPCFCEENSYFYDSPAVGLGKLFLGAVSNVCSTCYKSVCSACEPSCSECYGDIFDF